METYETYLRPRPHPTSERSQEDKEGRAFEGALPPSQQVGEIGRTIQRPLDEPLFHPSTEKQKRDGWVIKDSHLSRVSVSIKQAPFSICCAPIVCELPEVGHHPGSQSHTCRVSNTWPTLSQCCLLNE